MVISIKDWSLYIKPIKLILMGHGKLFIQLATKTTKPLQDVPKIPINCD